MVREVAGDRYAALGVQGRCVIGHEVNAGLRGSVGRRYPGRREGSERRAIRQSCPVDVLNLSDAIVLQRILCFFPTHTKIFEFIVVIIGTGAAVLQRVPALSGALCGGI